mgnify:FL=1
MGILSKIFSIILGCIPIMKGAIFVTSNGKLIIAIGSVVGVTLLGILVDDIYVSAIKSSNKYAEKKVLKQRTAENNDILSSVEEAVKQSDAVFAKEKELEKETFEMWKENSGYSAKMKALKEAKRDTLNQITNDFQYDSKKEHIISEADRKISEYKNQINFDQKLSQLQGEIDAAKSRYELEKGTLKLVTSDQTYDELKKTAKRVKNTTVENAERDIKLLKERLNDKVNYINQEKDKRLVELSSQLDSQQRAIVQKFDNDICELQKEASKKLVNIKDDIVKVRSPENTAIVNNAKRLSMEKEDILAAEEMIGANIIKDMTLAEKTACYFVDHKWSKTGVVAVALVPAIPVIFTAVKYKNFVIGVVKAMDVMKEI